MAWTFRALATTTTELRSHDPQQGRVLIDGQDIKGVSLPSLRGKLGLVPQPDGGEHGNARLDVAGRRRQDPPAATLRDDLQGNTSESKLGRPSVPEGVERPLGPLRSQRQAELPQSPTESLPNA